MIPNQPNPHVYCPLSNIKSYNDSHFYNSYGYLPRSESDSFIKFDFGPLIKIDLYSYFIRSNRGDQSYEHPKTWRIEGSNDDKTWTRLDRQLNNACLRGKYAQHHFICEVNIHGHENHRFRYIRYVQEDSWCSKHRFNVYITYFELYGDIFDYT